MKNNVFFFFFYIFIQEIGFGNVNHKPDAIVMVLKLFNIKNKS